MQEPAHVCIAMVMMVAIRKRKTTTRVTGGLCRIPLREVRFIYEAKYMYLGVG